MLETMEAEQIGGSLMSDENKKVEELEVEETVVEEPNMEMVMHDPNARIVTMKKLLAANVHYGHQTRKWDPRMGKFIYGARNGIYVVDLVKTIQQIEMAYAAMKKIVEDGGKVLFVGTNEKYRQIVIDEATRCGSFYISNRWLGGTLTNFRTIQGRTRVLKELEVQETDGTFERLPKKELSLLKKEKDKLSRNLEGIKEMRKIPNALFIIDPTTEHNAINEARKLHIPTFALVDTNSNPDCVDFPIPANDDSMDSVRLITSLMADAIVEAKGGLPVVAYTKDEGDEVTMKDVIKEADRANQEKLAKLREIRKQRQERFERSQSMRQGQRREDDDRYQVNGGEKETKSFEKKSEEKFVAKKVEKQVEKKPVAKEAKVEEKVEK